MNGCIAVLNAGSSSIKFALYEAGRDGALLFRGQVENIGLAAHLAAADAAGAVVAERRWGKGELDHRGATAEILKLGRELLAGRPVLAFGHRVVHGGTEFAAPVRVDAEHHGRAGQAGAAGAAPPTAQSRAHRGDRRRPAPHMPQVACFDTAFHRTQPPLAQDIRPAARAHRGRRAPLRLPRPVLRFHRVAAGRDRSRPWRSPGWSSPISAMAPACAPSPRAAAWPAPWASPPSTA